LYEISTGLEAPIHAGYRGLGCLKYEKFLDNYEIFLTKYEIFLVSDEIFLRESTGEKTIHKWLNCLKILHKNFFQKHSLVEVG